MRTYVCGFLFSPDRSHVLLIRKNRPAWQAGKLNGVGGKVEAGESFHAAMRREFREEAALDLPESAWRHCLTLAGSDDAGSSIPWAGHFFRAFHDLSQTRTLTDEHLETHPTSKLPPDTIPNLHWLIPLLLDDDVVECFAYHLTIPH